MLRHTPRHASELASETFDQPLETHVAERKSVISDTLDKISFNISSGSCAAGVEPSSGGTSAAWSEEPSASSIYRKVRNNSEYQRRIQTLREDGVNSSTVRERTFRLFTRCIASSIEASKFLFFSSSISVQKRWKIKISHNGRRTTEKFCERTRLLCDPVAYFSLALLIKFIVSSK